MLLAQISDTHILAEGHKLFGTLDSAEHLERTVAHLNRVEPDYVLVTGDIADDGAVASYRNFERILSRLKAPYLLLAGNHDSRDNMRTVFGDRLPGENAGPFIQGTVEDFSLRLVGLDTVQSGSDAGLVCQARLDWLDRVLSEEPQRPTVVAMHHPPFATGIKESDAIMCANGPALAAVIAGHPQVVRIACGHIHRPIAVQWAGRTASVAPSTAHQVELGLGDGKPMSWLLEPPGYHLHVWYGGADLITHVSYTGDYGPATKFD